MSRLLSVLALLAIGCSSGPVPNLNSSDPYERFLGALEAADSGAPEDIANIVGLLKDKDPLARTGAIVSLVIVRHPDTVKLVTGMLQDPDAGVRLEAVRTLGNFKQPPSVEPIVAILQRDPAVETRRVAALALGNFPDSPGLRAALLGAYLQNDAGVAFNAYKSLSKVTGKPNLPRIHGAAVEALNRG